MAKKSSDNVERRARAEQLRKQAERAEKRRSALILGGALVAVAALIAAALIPYLQDQRERSEFEKLDVADIGVSAEAADCGEKTTKNASGSAQHLPPGTPIPYEDAPPAFGPHWPNFLQGTEIRTFYTRDDRPELERLVHSLEHGHTLVWYDDSITEDSPEYEDLQKLGDKFGLASYLMVVPWTAEDGDAFPEGKRIAMTHWTGPNDQKGVTQYCAAPSGEVLKDFMEKYPKLNAPEPGAA